MNTSKGVFFCVFMLLFFRPAFADLAQLTVSPVVEPPDITMSLLKVAGGLLLVILSILGSAWVYRRFGNLVPIANDSLKIIGGTSLGAKERVVLMQVGEDQVLLGVSPGRIQCLHVLNKNIDIEENQVKEDKSFSVQLNSALKQWKSK